MDKNQRVNLEIEYSYLDLELSRLYIDFYMLHSIKNENVQSIKCLNTFKVSSIDSIDSYKFMQSVESGINNEQFSIELLSSRMNDIFLEMLDKEYRKDTISRKLAIK